MGYNRYIWFLLTYYNLLYMSIQLKMADGFDINFIPWCIHINRE